MPRKPRRTTAQKLANPNWRATLPDSALTPQQRASRTRNKALKADPLAPVSSMKDLLGQAGPLVDTQQADEKNAIGAAKTTADQEFATRGGMYKGLADIQSQGYQNAFTNTTSAINNLIATTQGATTADQGNLAAALRKAEQDRLAAYKVAGAEPSADIAAGDADRLASVANVGQGIMGQIGQAGAGQVGAATERQAIPGQGLAINLANLTGERNKALGDVKTRTDKLASDRKNLMRQAVRDLQDFEVAKRQYGDQHSSMLFQQYLGEKELDAKIADMGFQQWLSRQNLSLAGRQQTLAERVGIGGLLGTDPVTGQTTSAQSEIDAKNEIDWFNAHTNRTAANNEYQRLLQASRTEKDDTKKKELAARAEALRGGIIALNEYFAPNPGEGAPPGADARYPVGTDIKLIDPKTGQQVTKPATQADVDAKRAKNVDDPIPQTGQPYVRRFQGALDYLKSQGMSHSNALRVLAMSDYSDWKAKARGMLSRMKRRQRGEKAPEPKPKRKYKTDVQNLIPGAGPFVQKP